MIYFPIVLSLEFDGRVRATMRVDPNCRCYQLEEVTEHHAELWTQAWSHDTALRDRMATLLCWI
jgi:hypothetical protein